MKKSQIFLPKHTPNAIGTRIHRCCIFNEIKICKKKTNRYIVYREEKFLQFSFVKKVASTLGVSYVLLYRTAASSGLFICCISWTIVKILFTFISVSASVFFTRKVYPAMFNFGDEFKMVYVAGSVVSHQDYAACFQYPTTKSRKHLLQ